ncbi:hypothetical protein FXB42_03720 [Acetobacterium wieringae]|uniref:Uncharacterized protein n=1 Tax=Acetobacterium wieringae TaxID=52694 RepID=A0A5D0WU99_9FIRM|nr:hypothetical protein [Acetobacterium wieringae]TYC87566.1 hypothetical protein FXB42_03720 [Acetobacterium wieringae]
MTVKIKEILEEQKGSSLAFVIIIGVIIMIMVVSLLSVANSDFTFTQQTVESRQAYIDAKSVIEFGKIEINYRMSVLREKNLQLKGLYNDYEFEKAKENPDATKLEALSDEIKKLEEDILQLEDNLKNRFDIYGDKSNVAETLTDSDPDPTESTIVCIGELSVTKEEGYNYSFEIETQELRRKLDYQAEFTYRPLTVSAEAGGGTPGVIQGKPSGNWNDSFFHITGQGVQMNTSGYGNIKKSGSVLNADFSANNANIDVNKGFAWENNTKLILTANNICITDPLPMTGVVGSQFHFKALGTPAMPATKKTPATKQIPGQIRFEKNYSQVNRTRNSLIADNIVFMGDLVIDQNSYLEINCTNLWVAGNIIIRTDVPAAPSFINRITAQNIIVGGEAPNNKSITVINPERVVWTCDNFYLNGRITNEYSTGGSSISNPIIIGKPGVPVYDQDRYQ